MYNNSDRRSSKRSTNFPPPKDNKPPISSDLCCGMSRALGIMIVSLICGICIIVGGIMYRLFVSKSSDDIATGIMGFGGVVTTCAICYLIFSYCSCCMTTQQPTSNAIQYNKANNNDEEYDDGDDGDDERANRV
jgi:hypothetical protein